MWVIVTEKIEIILLFKCCSNIFETFVAQRLYIYWDNFSLFIKEFSHISDDGISSTLYRP